MPRMSKTLPPIKVSDPTYDRLIQLSETLETPMTILIRQALLRYLADHPDLADNNSAKKKGAAND